MILPSGLGFGMVLSAAAAAGYAGLAVAGRRLDESKARWILLVSWVLHAAVLAWSLLGDSPRFGFAPALSMTAWLVLTFYAIEREMFPLLPVRWALATLGTVTVLLAFAFPGQELHMSASPWLPLHLALGVASYGLFAAAAVQAWLMRRAERSIRKAGDSHTGVPLLTLERLTFRFAAAGFVVLSATLLAGIFFRESLGPWRWDHKTVFSVAAWVAFGLLLTGRARFGWRGRKAVSVLYTGSLLLLLAYVGSRFVMEVMLGRAA